jgi:hypothetical protein
MSDALKPPAVQRSGLRSLAWAAGILIVFSLAGCTERQQASDDPSQDHSSSPGSGDGQATGGESNVTYLTDGLKIEVSFNDTFRFVVHTNESLTVDDIEWSKSDGTAIEGAERFVAFIAAGATGESPCGSVPESVVVAGDGRSVETSHSPPWSIAPGRWDLIGRAGTAGQLQFTIGEATKSVFLQAPASPFAVSRMAPDVDIESAGKFEAVFEHEIEIDRPTLVVTVFEVYGGGVPILNPEQMENSFSSADGTACRERLWQPERAFDYVPTSVHLPANLMVGLPGEYVWSGRFTAGAQAEPDEARVVSHVFLVPLGN